MRSLERRWRSQRTFSTMRRVKTYMRSTMLTDRLSSLALLRNPNTISVSLYGDSCHVSHGSYYVLSIISNILDTANVWDHLSSYLLVLLRCRVYTNAHSRVSKQPIMRSKRGYVSKDLVALDLVKSQAKVYLWKHWPLPLRFSNTS